MNAIIILSLLTIQLTAAAQSNAKDVQTNKREWARKLDGHTTPFPTESSVPLPAPVSTPAVSQQVSASTPFPTYQSTPFPTEGKPLRIASPFPTDVAESLESEMHTLESNLGDIMDEVNVVADEIAHLESTASPTLSPTLVCLKSFHLYQQNIMTRIPFIYDLTHSSSSHCRVLH